MKYDKIVEISKERSKQYTKIAFGAIEEMLREGKQNAEIVKNEIQKMLERKERVTVAALVRYTGFSNSFFYKNKEVKNAVKSAQLQQGECYNPKKAIFDMVLEEKVANLKIAITKLKKQNKELLGTNERLENELKRVKAENEELKQIISGR